MGKRGLPPLKIKDIVAILLAAGFEFVEEAAKHDKYEGMINGQRRVVMVSRSVTEVSDWLLKAIIEQSGLSKNEFYGLTASTAAKFQCTFLKNGLQPAEEAQ